MTNELLNNPEARFNAALSFATSEFQGQIDLEGYSDVPTPYFSDIYASQYFKLVEDVLEVVRSQEDVDMLFHELIELTKKRAEQTNGEAIESGKFALAQELNSYPDKMPEADEHNKIKRKWDKV